MRVPPCLRLLADLVLVFQPVPDRVRLGDLECRLQEGVLLAVLELERRPVAVRLVEALAEAGDVKVRRVRVEHENVVHEACGAKALLVVWLDAVLIHPRRTYRSRHCR